MADERGEGVLPARGAHEVGDRRAARPDAHHAVLDLLGGGDVGAAVLVGRVGRHEDGGLRQRDALQEPPPVALADGLADVDRERGVVDLAAAAKRDETRLRRDDDGGRRIAVALRVEEEDAVFLQEEPGIEEGDSPNRAVRLPQRLGVGEPPEEGEVEVLHRLGEVLDAVEEVERGVALLVSERLVGVGADGDRPVEGGDGGGAALDAREERRVRALDLGVEPVETLGVAAPRRVEDVLRLADGEPLKRVRPFEPGGARVAARCVKRSHE